MTRRSPHPGRTRRSGPLPHQPALQQPAPAPNHPGAPSRPGAAWDPGRPLAGPLLTLGVATLVALIAGLLVTAARRSTDLLDPGALVRWSLPITASGTDLAAGVTIGALALAAFVVSPRSRAWPRLRSIAVWASLVWTGLWVLRLTLDYADVAGVPLGSPGFSEQVGLYLTQVDRGRLLLAALVVAAVTATVVFGMNGPVWALVALAGAGASLLCVAFTGHSAGAAFHELAVSSLWLHVLGLGLWAGGLVCLLALAPLLGARAPKRGPGGPELSAVVARYSALAGVGFVLVATSGIGNGVIRLGSWSALFTDYGTLLIVKTALLVGLGVAGWMQRRRVIPALAEHGRAGFTRLAMGEVAVLGAATGLGVAMSVSPPPLPDEPPAYPSPAELVSSAPLPPPLTAASLVTEITPDILYAVIIGFAAAAYLKGVHTLRRRGDSWPMRRALTWLAGLAALLYITCGGIAVYGRVMFSAHMVQHMALTMIAPVLLSFGAPVTLLLRVVPARRDGSMGPREWVLGALHTRYLRFFSHPVVAAINFAGGIIAFYYSELFGLALSTHLGHELMMLHFTATGYLFAQAVVAVDPVPVRLAYPMRLVLLLATMGFHAFFGVTLMQATALLEATYFSSLGVNDDLLADQARGGALAWGIGELPTVLLAMLLTLEWARNDDREARRRDRKADRDEDAERRAYNEMLASLAKR
ncbi:MAG: copper resistance protein CopD [Micrococcales bacterium]|nr:MAG: copper resistance protein CopD [Micrococcales bacterium]